jgi:hydroxylamine reductase
MFCYQCQETLKNTGCNQKAGMCGKSEEVANLQDLIVFALKGVAVVAEKAKAVDVAVGPNVGSFIMERLFATITNVNFDADVMIKMVREALALRETLKAKLVTAYQQKHGKAFQEPLPDAATWYSDDVNDFTKKATEVGILATAHEDVRSLRSLLLFGVKGLAAYGDHASVLEYEKSEIFDFVIKALAALTNDSLTADDLVALVLECGKFGVETMALLDQANTETYGQIEPTQVNLGVRNNPGILVSGHDLRDFHDLLEQTKGTGVDVYTHSEMLPAHYYPTFKKYDHLVGNYGSSWWHQKEDFEKFNGPILMTTNCLVPPKDAYKDRVFTTGVVGFPGVKHIADRKPGKQKDFSAIIALAKTCQSPTQLESGTIPGGFGHTAVLQLADKVIAAVKAGAIKRFVVMAGCDGRHKERDYFTHVAENLPQDTIILTAGCAKYRYNKLNLGDIGGIPRVLDAGQCNNSYSLAVIALKLKEAFGLDDVNKLPLSFDIAWYEQKAVLVLLAVLYLGFKNIRLGPTLPAFLSPNVANVLVEKFDIKPTTNAETDVAAMMTGK